MPEGGILTLETANATLPDASGQRQGDAAPGECVQLVVRDTGRGMNLHEKEHLFEPFFTTKEPGKGTGLGLATCYGIIKQSGGHIEIESAPGQGTTVHIFLPRVQAVLAAPVSAPQPAELPRGSERVLLVEDEPAVRQLASLLLRELGYRVVEASEGAEALRLLREVGEGPFDLLITDVIMPAMGGRELAERAVELQPGLKVLYMSGYTGDSLSQQGALVPGVVLLEKPFHSGTLARKVRQALG
jgi:two-component system cell cycle sensor histidine kinase/response regulator CckA